MIICKNCGKPIVSYPCPYCKILYPKGSPEPPIPPEPLSVYEQSVVDDRSFMRSLENVNNFLQGFIDHALLGVGRPVVDAVHSYTYTPDTVTNKGTASYLGGAGTGIVFDFILLHNAASKMASWKGVSQGVANYERAATVARAEVIVNAANASVKVERALNAANNLKRLLKIEEFINGYGKMLMRLGSWKTLWKSPKAFVAFMKNPEFSKWIFGDFARFSMEFTRYTLMFYKLVNARRRLQQGRISQQQFEETRARDVANFDIGKLTWAIPGGGGLYIACLSMMWGVVSSEWNKDTFLQPKKK